MNREASKVGVERFDEHLSLPKQYRSVRNPAPRSSPHQSISLRDTVFAIRIVLKETVQPAKNEFRQFRPNRLQFVEGVADVRKAKSGAPVSGERSIRGDRRRAVPRY